MPKRKTGFLIFNKSNGKTYVVIRKSKRVKNTVIKKTIYSFGSYPQALEKMIAIKNGEIPFPEELITNSFDGEDLEEWIHKTITKMS